jgi:hypothetical protein
VVRLGKASTLKGELQKTVSVTLAVSVGVAWHAAGLDAARLQVELTASQAALVEQVLASIETQKIAVRTPQEVVSGR